MEKSKTTIFQNKKAVPFLALIAVGFWGAAFPFIKLGMEQFQIEAGDTAAKTLFAGIRFLIAGLIVLMIAKIKGSSLKLNIKNFFWIVLFALINTTLHYFFFYIGVSNSTGSRASVLDSLGTFLLVFLSCAFFKNEHLTKNRILGCLAGFIGLLCLNLDAHVRGSFTLNGDGMMILNSVCSAFGGILTRIVGKKTDVFIMTGLGLFLGGLMLLLGGIAMGGSICVITPAGVGDMIVLISISAIGFSVYNQLLLYHPVGRVAIYNSLIPIFGIVFSGLLLKEDFNARYLIAAFLVALGVFVINRE